MNSTHFQYWPARLPKTLTVPKTTLYENLVITTKKYPQNKLYTITGNLIRTNNCLMKSKG